jgi:hypothetical protein
MSNELGSAGEIERADFSLITHHSLLEFSVDGRELRIVS